MMGMSITIPPFTSPEEANKMLRKFAALQVEGALEKEWPLEGGETASSSEAAATGQSEPVVDVNPTVLLRLTTANISKELQRLEENIASKWQTVGTELFQISPTKVMEITKDCKSDEGRLEALIDFWLTWYPFTSWRWFVKWFEDNKCPEKADAMRKYVKPIDPTLTVANIASIDYQANLKFINEARSAGRYLCGGFLIGATQEACEERAKGWLASSTYPNWESMAETLFQAQDSYGLELVRERVNHATDPTLTAANMSAVLATIEDWSKFKVLLRISRYSPSQGKDAVIREYLDKHPAPSWKRVARAVYEMARHENCYDVLQEIYQKYINVSLQNRCVFAVRKFLRSSDDVHHLPLPDRLKELVSV